MPDPQTPNAIKSAIKAALIIFAIAIIGGAVHFWMNDLLSFDNIEKMVHLVLIAIGAAGFVGLTSYQRTMRFK